MKSKSGTKFYAIGPEADALFQNLCKAVRQGTHKKIHKIQTLLDAISKRQLAQLKSGVPLENLL